MGSRSASVRSSEEDCSLYCSSSSSRGLNCSTKPFSTRTDGGASVSFTLHLHLFTSERISFAFRIFDLHQVRCITIATSTTQGTLDRDLDCAVILFSRPRMYWDEESQQFLLCCPDVSSIDLIPQSLMLPKTEIVFHHKQMLLFYMLTLFCFLILYCSSGLERGLPAPSGGVVLARRCKTL